MSIYDQAQSRQALIVWMYSNKKVKQLQKYGFVYYVSRKMKYAVLYTDVSEADHIQKNLEKLHFVRRVDVSPRQAMSTDYATAFDTYAADLMAKKDSDDKDRLNERYA